MGYPDVERYTFNPSYIMSDLRRVISFALNKIGISSHNIYVMSDLSPDPQVVDTILMDYQYQAIEKFKNMGYDHKITRSVKKRPLDWLYEQCKKIQPESAKDLYDKIRMDIIPNIRTSNSLEFASLFTRFINIDGKRQYNNELKNIGSLITDNDQVFWYFSGHSVRLTSNGTVYDQALVIQRTDGSPDYMKSNKLYRRIGNLNNTMMIFDCCHSAGLFEPTGQNTVYLASANEKESCGFYDNKTTNEYGSLFTVILFRYLNQGIHHLDQLHNKIVHDVGEYRKKMKKEPQSMTVKISPNTNFEITTVDHLIA
jgi:hypothetical protein